MVSLWGRLFEIQNSEDSEEEKATHAFAEEHETAPIQSVEAVATRTEFLRHGFQAPRHWTVAPSRNDRPAVTPDLMVPRSDGSLDHMYLAQ